MVTYTTVNNTKELQQILDLQKSNLEISVGSEESKSQGFVTVHHDMELLSSMNDPYPHVIAKDGDQVIGYTLVMLKDLRDKIPVLLSMFEEIDSVEYEGIHLGTVDYFVMGQVCIDKPYRGKGIFRGLYEEMKKQMAPHFKYIITEIATRNTRSIRAHEKIGFKEIHQFRDNTEEWSLILWDWS